MSSASPANWGSPLVRAPNEIFKWIRPASPLALADIAHPSAARILDSPNRNVEQPNSTRAGEPSEEIAQGIAVADAGRIATVLQDAVVAIGTHPKVGRGSAGDLGWAGVSEQADECRVGIEDAAMAG